MLNDDNRITALGQPLQNLYQLMHIRRMQSRCGLIQNIDRFACAFAAQLRCQLHALRFTARKRCGGLPKLHIGKTDII